MITQFECYVGTRAKRSEPSVCSEMQILPEQKRPLYGVDLGMQFFFCILVVIKTGELNESMNWVVIRCLKFVCAFFDI